MYSLSVQEAGANGETSLLGGVGHTWDLKCNPQAGKKVTHSLHRVCTLICNHRQTTAALVVSKSIFTISLKSPDMLDPKAYMHTDM